MIDITRETKRSTLLSWRDVDYAMLADPVSQVLFTAQDVGELIDGNGSPILETDLRTINLKTGLALYLDSQQRVDQRYRQIEHRRLYAAPVTAVLSNGRRIQEFVIVKRVNQNTGHSANSSES